MQLGFLAEGDNVTDSHQPFQGQLPIYFFYSNTNNLVQLEDTAIKTERCCLMQCTERTRAMHHIIDFYLYFKSNIVFGVIIDNQISLRD